MIRLLWSRDPLYYFNTNNVTTYNHSLRKVNRTREEQLGAADFKENLSTPLFLFLRKCEFMLIFLSCDFPSACLL